MNLEQILEQAGTARPGYELASFKEAGLPVYLLTVRVLTLEKKPLGPIEEGVLKAVDAGLNTSEDVSAFLGLSLNVLVPVLAGLNTTELINYLKGSGQEQALISVTTKGRNALAEAATIRPQEKTVRICLDALTRRLLFISPVALNKPRFMKELGLYEVPTGSAKRPELEDIPLQEFDKALSLQNIRGDTKGELLSLRRIERRELNYLPCVMLFYRNMAERQEVIVGFWREDGPALQHETCFREFGGPEVVGAKLLSNGSAGPTEDVIAQVAEYVPVPEPAIVELRFPEESPASPSAAVLTPATAAVLAPLTLQSIECHEHPGLLKKALNSSLKRLLIISPWITSAVVDYGFISSLEALLRRRVDVFIGYGLDDGDDGRGKGAEKNRVAITKDAERELRALESKYRNFRLVYVGNTHRKALVSDDSFAVVTSFNWLSFRGDPKKPPRDEGGVVIRKSEYVEAEFAKGMKLLDEGYSGRASGKGNGAAAPARGGKGYAK
jgi:hypothetical protein